ncbi:MAG: hypothetical protein WCT18_03435 [Patescibacteria group bacterium]
MASSHFDFLCKEVNKVYSFLGGIYAEEKILRLALERVVGIFERKGGYRDFICQDLLEEFVADRSILEKYLLTRDFGSFEYFDWDRLDDSELNEVLLERMFCLDLDSLTKPRSDHVARLQKLIEDNLSGFDFEERRLLLYFVRNTDKFYSCLGAEIKQKDFSFFEVDEQLLASGKELLKKGKQIAYEEERSLYEIVAPEIAYVEKRIIEELKVSIENGHYKNLPGKCILLVMFRFQNTSSSSLWQEMREKMPSFMSSGPPRKLRQDFILKAIRNFINRLFEDIEINTTIKTGGSCQLETLDISITLV